ncbi:MULTISPECIES: glycosyltransferase [Vibrio]|uniref:glycosyltransferase n=1 Tax=Vibrio TaxID=662 RepID=UPI00061931B7|nr:MULTISPECIES: glycosyltransferase [Vibrio]QCI72094.1 glycosyltransferase [Vibrio cyclitrophicus]
MKILAFLSEPFCKRNEKYISNKASLNFIKDCFDEGVVCVGRVVEETIEMPSVVVDSALFEEIPNYDSILDFAKKSVRSPTFIFNYIKRCQELLRDYPSSKVWVRNPSIGCLIFSLVALKKKRKVYNHMCANAMEAWDNPKYSGITKVFAYIFSRFLKYLVIKVVKNPLTVNLCTGDELLKFCLRYNQRSHLLIDSTLESKNTVSCAIGRSVNRSKFKYTFIGRIQEDKGILDLISAFKQLDQNDFELEIIGTGILYDNLRKNNSNPSVRFLGQVDNNKIGGYLLDSNVVVVPSKNRYEGFPRVILEAWSCGIPVIVSNVGGVNSFVINNKNGIVIEAGNITELLKAMSDSANQELYDYLCSESKNMESVTTKEYWVNEFRSINHV